MMASAMARPVLMAVVVAGTAVIATPGVMPAVVVVAEPLFVGGRRA